MLLSCSFLSLFPKCVHFCLLVFSLVASHQLACPVSLSSTSLCLTPSSKYRPSSEQHNDNFSLSTIAEGSHPNVRKLCDTPPNVPHARALAYYDNIICQVTWFSPLSQPFFCTSLPPNPARAPDSPHLMHGHEYPPIT